MQPVNGTPPMRDPAPSRTAYRMHRLWLTPLFRAMLRVGLPAFAVAFAAGIYLSDPVRRDEIIDTIAEVRQSFQERPSFMVREMVIEGASASARAAIMAVLPGDLPQSSFDLDLVALRGAVEAVDAVAGADLRIIAEGVLTVRITERQPVVLLRGAAGLVLLDATGHPVWRADTRGAYPDLPLIAGAGAETKVAEARALWAAAAPIAHRVRGLVRMGERRWDLVLDRDQRILLPESDPVPVLERVIALDQARDVLARDVLAVDLRIPHRPTLRMSKDAVDAMWQIRVFEQETSGQ